MRMGMLALLCVAPLSVSAQDPVAEAPAPIQEDATTLETIRVTAPRLQISDIYVSKEIIFTESTVFDRAWREPVNLKKIGDEGGVVPLLVNYAAKKVAQGARKLPGWKGPDQAAVARPPPLDEAQMQRALRLREQMPTP